MNRLFEGTKIELGQFEWAMADFQKAALTQDFDTTVMLFRPWLQGDDPTEHQQVLMKNLYELTKLETKGNLVKMVADVYNDKSSSSSTKLDAVKLMDALIEGKTTLSEEDGAKLIIKLAKSDDE